MGAMHRFMVGVSESFKARMMVFISFCFTLCKGFWLQLEIGFEFGLGLRLQ